MTYVGLKIHVDHDSKWTPDLEHTAWVLLAVRINLWIEDGRIGQDISTSIADIRTKGEDFLGFGNKERKLTDRLNDAVQGSIEKRLKEDVAKTLKDKFGSVPVRSLHVSDEGVRVQLGVAEPKSQASSITMSKKTTPLVTKSVLLGCKSENDAVLRVTFYREDMLLHAATLGKRGLGPENVMNRQTSGKGNFWPHEREHQQDKKTPGRHRVTLYLGEGYETRDIGGVKELRLGGSWNDHVAVVIVEAGPKWNKHSLFLTEHPFDRAKGGKSWGTQLSLSPGITCLDLAPFRFTKKATGLSVSRMK